MDRTQAERFYEDWRGKAELWAGALIPALAWFAHLNMMYIMVDKACAREIHWPFHVITLVLLIVAALGCLLAWRSWERTGRDWATDDGGVIPRSSFMAIWGVVLGSLFVLLIIAQHIPGFILHPCQR